MGVFELPDGYHEIKRVDLQKDKRLAILINVGAFAIIIALLIVGFIFAPIKSGSIIFEIGSSLLEALGLLLAVVLYAFAHEFVHGIFIKKYSGKKAKYGFTGLYAYAGSDAYFNRREYIIIALAPVVLFGVLFLLLNLFLPNMFFWWVYFLQIMNLSGAAGDFYITGLVCTLPADILTNDEGFTMVIYSQTLGH